MIRKATEQDASGIAETHVLSWQFTYRGMVPEEFLAALSVPQREESWKQRFSSGGGVTFVAELDGAVAGFADFGPSRDKDKDSAHTGELYAIYLRAEAQGLGFGRKLIEQGVAWLKRAGFTEVTTLVLEENSVARSFYRQMGMMEDGTKIAANIGGQDVIEIRYAMTLDSVSAA